jgi:membrane-associated protein
LSGWINDALSATAPFLLYLTLFSVVFLETGVLVAFFLPGDSVLFAAGLLAATRNDTNIVILIIVIFFAAFLGDQIGYVLGRKYGRSYLERRSSKRINGMVDRAENFYEKYGWSAVILARFYPWIRTFMPPIAGIGKMNYYRFLAANALGALLWGCGLTLLGFYAASIPVLKDSSHYIATICVVLTIAITLKNYIRTRRDFRTPPTTTPM